MSGVGSQKAGVPLFRSLAAEQRNTPTAERSATRNTTGAIDLKALARKVLDRNTQRNTSGAKPENECSAPPLKIEHSGTPVPVADEDDFEERAAIIEQGAGVPREWAEGFARLDTERPPGDVPARRWLSFVDDAGRFLDGGWANRAAALGWGPLELFGADRLKPFARVDKMGLVWLLNKRRLLALTKDTAAIENRNSPPHTYRRVPAQDGHMALPWELAP